MTAFDRAQLRHVATLARLPLSAEEEERFARELAGILAAFEGLAAASSGPAGANRRMVLHPAEPAPPDGVPSGAEPPARPDTVAPAPPATVAAIRAAFPRRDGAFAKVPRGL